MKNLIVFALLIQMGWIQQSYAGCSSAYQTALHTLAVRDSQLTVKDCVGPWLCPYSFDAISLGITYVAFLPIRIVGAMAGACTMGGKAIWNECQSAVISSDSKSYASALQLITESYVGEGPQLFKVMKKLGKNSNVTLSEVAAYIAKMDTNHLFCVAPAEPSTYKEVMRSIYDYAKTKN